MRGSNSLMSLLMNLTKWLSCYFVSPMNFCTC